MFLKRIITYLAAIGLMLSLFQVVAVLAESAPADENATSDQEQREPTTGREQVPALLRSGTPLTTLKAAPPEASIESLIGTNRLRRVTVKVKNTGEATAEGIKVKVITPNDTEFEASGPDRLMGGMDATYTCYPGEYIYSEEGIRTEVRCTNCEEEN